MKKKENDRLLLIEYNTKKGEKYNPYYNRDKHRKAELRRNYNLTLDDYQRMFNEQKGYCAICGRHQTELKKTLCVDHDHVTGEIRELLCHSCNVAIGLLKDNSKITNNATEYLIKYKK